MYNTCPKIDPKASFTNEAQVVQSPGACWNFWSSLKLWEEEQLQRLEIPTGFMTING